MEDSIKDIDTLINEMGDESSGRVKDTIDLYNKINQDFDTFILGETYSTSDVSKFNGMTTEEKLIKLAEMYSSNNEKRTALEEEFQKKEQRMNSLKEIANKILLNQSELINKNYSIIEDLEKKLKNDLAEKLKLEAEIELIDEELETSDKKITKRESEISSLEKEINSLKAVKAEIESKELQLSSLESELETLKNATPSDDKEIAKKEGEISTLSSEITSLKSSNPSYYSVDKKENELSTLRKEKRELEDRKIELDTSKTNKDIKIKKLDITNKEKKIEDLKEKNRELEEHLEKNHEVLKNNLKDLDIEKTKNERQQANQGNSQQQTQGNVEKGGKQQGGGAGGTVGDNKKTEEASLTNLSDREIADNMFRNYIQATTLEEKKNYLKWPEYKYLVETGRNIRGINRRKFYNSLKKTRNQLGRPNRDEFKDKYIELMGEDKGEEWFNLLFDENGNARNFRGMGNSLSVDELRKVKEAVEEISSRRSELSSTNPELLKYFDDNFVQFVQIDSLMEKTSRRGPFKAVRDYIGGGKGAICDDLSAQMKGYTEKRYNENIQKQNYTNSWREKLGRETVSIEEQKLGINGRNGSEIQNLNRQYSDRSR